MKEHCPCKDSCKDNAKFYLFSLKNLIKELVDES